MVFLIGLNVNLYAQQRSTEEYCKAIEEYFCIKNGSAWIDGLSETLDVKILAEVAKESNSKLSNAQCKELAALYKEKKLKTSFLKMLIPYFRHRQVWPEDLQRLAEEMKKPEFKEAQDRYLAGMERMPQVLAQSLQIVNDTATIVAVDCPEGYKQLFQDYYEKADMKSTMSSSIKKIVGAMTSDMKLEEKAVVYFVLEHSYTLLLNCFYSIVREEDLQALIAMESLPKQYVTNLAIIDFASADMQRLGLGVISDYERWVRMMCTIRNW